MASLAEKKCSDGKRKRKLHHTAAVGAQRQTPARIFGKLTFPKRLQMSTSSFVWGGKTQPVTASRTEPNSATELGIGGVCEAHLGQRCRERATRGIGLILTDRLRVEVAGFPSSVGQVEVEKSEKSTVRSAAA